MRYQKGFASKIGQLTLGRKIVTCSLFLLKIKGRCSNQNLMVSLLKIVLFTTMFIRKWPKSLHNSSFGEKSCRFHWVEKWFYFKKWPAYVSWKNSSIWLFFTKKKNDLAYRIWRFHFWKIFSVYHGVFNRKWPKSLYFSSFGQKKW